MIKKTIGRLLHAANTSPPCLARGEFYAMKDRILARFGTLAGHNIQHIKYDCWGCKGTGVFIGFWHSDDEDYGEKWIECEPMKCQKCGGTGVFAEIWVLLEVHNLGGHRFHRPVFRTRDPQHPGFNGRALGPIFDGGQFIEGKIELKPHRHHVEACYWLALFFDRPLFGTIWGRTKHEVATPLARLSGKVFGARAVARRIKYAVRYIMDREDIPF
ncbi:MAG: hypothetical protein ABIL58_23505 [Pseudomonadota bacterium]